MGICKSCVFDFDGKLVCAETLRRVLCEGKAVDKAECWRWANAPAEKKTCVRKIK